MLSFDSFRMCRLLYCLLSDAPYPMHLQLASYSQTVQLVDHHHMRFKIRSLNMEMIFNLPLKPCPKDRCYTSSRSNPLLFLRNLWIRSRFVRGWESRQSIGSQERLMFLFGCLCLLMSASSWKQSFALHQRKWDCAQGLFIQQKLDHNQPLQLGGHHPTL